MNGDQKDASATSDNPLNALLGTLGMESTVNGPYESPNKSVLVAYNIVSVFR